jgi:eukaryotic-like serine/threonine-protein kinase
MRPDHPSGNVVDLEGEELEELIEGELPQQPQPFAETEELDISGAKPVSVSVRRSRTPTPDNPMRTGPGRMNPPPSEPMAPLPPSTRTPSVARVPGPLSRAGTEPMSQASVPAVTGPMRPDPTASLRKGGGSVAAHPSLHASVPTAQQQGSKPRARAGPRRARSKPGVDENVGQVLGSYRILSGIGEGGMGKVYLADHVKLGRKVALKLLRPEYAVKRDAVSRFFKEAQAVNKIRHENIVDITDFVELDTGETYIIMELLEGDDLADLTRKADSPMPLHRAMQISLQVCDALEAAHKVGVIHRDLKPDNIFIINTATKKDFVKLLDFGVAKLLGESTEADGWQTAAGSVIGTPAYMSPEQASGIPVDARSDIYSLGAILYELFTGHPVFRAKSFGEYVIKHMNDDPVPPRDLADAPKIPAALERVILRCLEKDPNRRYPMVSDLREDLARATATAATAIETIPVGPRPSRRRRRALIAIPIAAAVVLLAVGAFWLASGLSLDEVTKPMRDPYTPAAGSGSARRDPVPGTEPLPPAKVVTAKIRLITDPPGAEVFRKGEAKSLGRTPFELRMAMGEDVEFIYRLAGHNDAVEKVTVAGDADYSQPLEKKTAAKKSGKVRPGKKGGKTKPEPAVEDAKTKPEPKPKTKKPGKVNPEDQVDPFGG